MSTSTMSVSGFLHPRTRREMWVRLTLAFALVVGFMVSYSGLRSARAAFSPVAGTLVSGSINSAAAAAGPLPTLPRGVVWMADASAPGGHWWVGDSLLGLCRLDPVGVLNSGPYALAACDATARSGGQIVVGAVPGDATAMYMYVGDTSAKSLTVVRYKITGVNTPAPLFGSKLPMKITNINQNGGGVAAGRPSALALFPSPTLTFPNKQDLLVGYLKSGDIMRVSDVNETGSGSPAQSRVGSTSDGIGANSFAKVGNDVYVAELGGLGGVSKIVDPLGVTRAACTSASVCNAVATGSSVGFPGGLAYDGSRFLYVGDVRVGGASNFVYRLDLSTPTVGTVTLSNSVATFSAKNSSGVQTTYNSYTAPMAVGYRANGDLYVGGDTQFLAAVPVNQQGHIWKVVTPSAPPTISALVPNNGSSLGGDAVVITGTNFSTTPGATTVAFGSAAPVPAVCADATTCTVTTPGGSGVVDAVVTTGGQTTDVSAASKFTYNVPVGAHVTSISPTFATSAGGTTLTINGSGFTTDGVTTSVTFGVGAGGVAGGLATCTTTTSCTVVTPAGAGAVDVIVTAAGSASAAVPADVFSYTPVVSSLDITSGSAAGGDLVTVTGSGFTPATTISFGVTAGLGVACATSTTCTVTTPAGVGTVDVKATTGSQTGTLVGGFTYNPIVISGPQISSISPSAGSNAGGTVVTITGVNFPTITPAVVKFGALAGTFVSCTSSTTCTVDSPAVTTAGAVNITVTDPAAVPSVSNPAAFTYVQATAGLLAWGITAPKGGATWIPGALGGHWWSSDHGQGFCRQDLLTDGSGRSAINFSVCGDDLVGSAGQGVYDPRSVNAYDNVGAIIGTFPSLHYVYVPDNAVRSTAVWRLTFNSSTETMVADPTGGAMATAMTPLADVRTLKPNGMALGPLNGAGVFCGLLGTGCSAAQNAAIGLYVTDLVEKYVRVVTNPEADPRTQTVGIVAATGDARGANGTAGFIGNNLYVSGNRGTQFFDVTQCPNLGAATPPLTAACGMATVPSPVGVFVAGTATDPVHKLVYQSNSPGGAAAALLRYDASHDVYVAFPDGTFALDARGVLHCEAAGCAFGPTAGNFLDGGVLPGPLGGPVVVATGPAGSGIGATRPWDLGNHPTLATKFSFAFGLAVGPSGELIITEDPSAGARSGRGSMWTVPFTG